MARTLDPLPSPHRNRSVTGFLCCVLLVVGLFLFGSQPAEDITFTIGIWGVVLAWMCIWPARMVLYFRRVKIGKHQHYRSWGHWCVEPMILLTMFFLMFTGTLVKWRLQLSIKAMEAYARTVPPNAVVRTLRTQWLGAYKVLAIESSPDGIVRFKTQDILFGEAGFAYIPVEQSPNYSKFDRFEHLFGTWWKWERHSNILKELIVHEQAQKLSVDPAPGVPKNL